MKKILKKLQIILDRI